VLVVIIGFKPRTGGIAGCAIRGIILTIDWGGGDGTKVSTKSHYSFVVDGMGGVGQTEDIGGINATRIKSGPNRFVTKGFDGGLKPSVNKSSGKLESSDVQIDSVIDLGV